MEGQSNFEERGLPVIIWNGTTLAIALALGLAVAVWAMSPTWLLPFGVAAGLTAAIGTFAVPLLGWLKTGQIIREEGPQSHAIKGGTPTMGGLYFVPIGLAVGLALAGPSPLTITFTATVLLFGAIGFADDWSVIKLKSNRGMPPKAKLALQILAAIAICGGSAWAGLLSTDVALPLLGSWSLGLLFWPLALFVLIGTNNAVNLTDGLDGLAASTVAIALVALAAIVPQPELALMAIALAGSCSGFLAQNRNPARVFMGDTGSLALGGALAAIALLGNCLWALAIGGGVFVAEALSVMAQVGYFKYTKRKFGEGKRLLRMSPLHHHLELGGWSETIVVTVLSSVGAVLACAIYALSVY